MNPCDQHGRREGRFRVGDLVQRKTEYLRFGHHNMFRIRAITAGTAVLGRLAPDSDGYIGPDTTLELDNPDLIAPYPELLALYSRHLR